MPGVRFVMAGAEAPGSGDVQWGEELVPLLRAGEAFWEAGGDVIHYSDANNRDDVRLRFLVTMMCVPGQPMLTLVSEEELAARRHLRVMAPPVSDEVDG